MFALELQFQIAERDDVARDQAAPLLLHRLAVQAQSRGADLLDRHDELADAQYQMARQHLSPGQHDVALAARADDVRAGPQRNRAAFHRTAEKAQAPAARGRIRMRIRGHAQRPIDRLLGSRGGGSTGGEGTGADGASWAGNAAAVAAGITRRGVSR